MKLLGLLALISLGSPVWAWNYAKFPPSARPAPISYSDAVSAVGPCEASLGNYVWKKIKLDVEGLPDQPGLLSSQNAVAFALLTTGGGVYEGAKIRLREVPAESSQYFLFGSDPNHEKATFWPREISALRLLVRAGITPEEFFQDHQSAQVIYPETPPAIFSGIALGSEVAILYRDPFDELRSVEGVFVGGDNQTVRLGTSEGSFSENIDRIVSIRLLPRKTENFDQIAPLEKRVDLPEGVPYRLADVNPTDWYKPDLEWHSAVPFAIGRRILALSPDGYVIFAGTVIANRWKTSWFGSGSLLLGVRLDNEPDPIEILLSPRGTPKFAGLPAKFERDAIKEIWIQKLRSRTP